jgi:hypothetical protein
VQHKAAVDDAHRLAAEKGALIDTIKKQNREIAKLDAFKRSLIQQLQDDDEVTSSDSCLAMSYGASKAG